MCYKPGDRVVAIRNSNNEEVFSFGAGVYEGDKPSPLGVPNPHIILDQGGDVWGYECWWMGEEEFKTKFLRGRRITSVKPDRPAEN